MKTYKELLTESGLSRLYKHYIEHDFGTISASRYAPECGTGTPYTKMENNKRNTKLKGILRKKGYQVTALQGSYIENYGSDHEREVAETSYFVSDSQNTGKLKQDLLRLGEEFEQDSIIFGKAGKAGDLIGTNNCPDAYPGYHKTVRQGGAIFGKTGEFMSRIHGRPFVFKESLDMQEYGVLKFPTELRGAVNDSKIEVDSII